MFASRFARFLAFALVAAVVPACGKTKSKKPYVSFHAPGHLEGSVARLPLIYVRFDRALDPTTLAGNVFLVDQASAQISCNVSYYAPLNEIRMIPNVALGGAATTPSYQVQLFSGIRSAEGGVFDGYFFQFSTIATTDVDRPSFVGVTSIDTATTTTLTLHWTSNATDTTTPGGINYDVFMATATGMEDLTDAYVTTNTTTGALIVTGLVANTQYFFIVKARDSFGNMDTNLNEMSGTTLP